MSRAGCRSQGKGGAQGRIRTTDTRIFSAMLYQLSYLGTSYRRDARKTVVTRDTQGRIEGA